MKKRKKKNHPVKKTVLGVGWYDQKQWDLLLEHSVDRNDLESTYAEWLVGVAETMDNLTGSGIHCERIPVDVEEMIAWCRENGYPFDGESRSVFISLKTKEKLS